MFLDLHSARFPERKTAPDGQKRKAKPDKTEDISTVSQIITKKYSLNIHHVFKFVYVRFVLFCLFLKQVLLLPYGFRTAGGLLPHERQSPAGRKNGWQSGR